MTDKRRVLTIPLDQFSNEEIVGMFNTVVKERDQAATEIERLLADRDEWKQSAQVEAAMTKDTYIAVLQDLIKAISITRDTAVNMKLERDAEIARLHTEIASLEAWIGKLAKDRMQHRAEIKQLRADNERLKEAQVHASTTDSEAEVQRLKTDDVFYVERWEELKDARAEVQRLRMLTVELLDIAEQLNPAPHSLARARIDKARKDIAT